MPTTFLNIGLIVLFWTTGLTAQQALDSIPIHDTFTLQSTHVGETRTVNVWTPPTYRDNAEPLPVLYMPDGGIQEDFPHIANTLSELIQSHKIQPIILVGIENTQRRRDLTGPTVVENDKKVAPVVGGSEAFRAFISEELFVEINKRYNTTSQKGIIGESLAGLFVTETFLLKPQLFDFYIAFDPSLWWNDQYLIKNAHQYLEAFPSQPKSFWFAASKAKDIFKNIGKWAEILEEKNMENLQWQFSPERKEEHSTIFRATKEKAIIWTLNTLPK